jgi:hypothetical protein
MVQGKYMANVTESQSFREIQNPFVAGRMGFPGILGGRGLLCQDLAESICSFSKTQT